ERVRALPGDGVRALWLLLTGAALAGTLFTVWPESSPEDMLVHVPIFALLVAAALSFAATRVVRVPVARLATLPATGLCLLAAARLPACALRVGRRGARRGGDARADPRHGTAARLAVPDPVRRPVPRALRDRVSRGAR